MPQHGHCLTTETNKKVTEKKKEHWNYKRWNYWGENPPEPPPRGNKEMVKEIVVENYAVENTEGEEAVSCAPQNKCHVTHAFQTWFQRCHCGEWPATLPVRVNSPLWFPFLRWTPLNLYLWSESVCGGRGGGLKMVKVLMVTGTNWQWLVSFLYLLIFLSSLSCAVSLITVHTRTSTLYWCSLF